MLDLRGSCFRGSDKRVVRSNVFLRRRQQSSRFFCQSERAFGASEELALERRFKRVNETGSTPRIKIERLGCAS